jgi:hypothetical protein
VGASPSTYSAFSEKYFESRRREVAGPGGGRVPGMPIT